MMTKRPHSRGKLPTSHIVEFTTLINHLSMSQVLLAAHCEDTIIYTRLFSFFFFSLSVLRLLLYYIFTLFLLISLFIQLLASPQFSATLGDCLSCQ
jgi:hypothetical protein